MLTQLSVNQGTYIVFVS